MVNGSQTSTEPVKASQRRAFYGKVLIVLQNNGEWGKATLTATIEGLGSATLTVQARWIESCKTLIFPIKTLTIGRFIFTIFA